MNDNSFKHFSFFPDNCTVSAVEWLIQDLAFDLAEISQENTENTQDAFEQKDTTASVQCEQRRGGVRVSSHSHTMHQDRS